MQNNRQTWSTGQQPNNAFKPNLTYALGVMIIRSFNSTNFGYVRSWLVLLATLIGGCSHNALGLRVEAPGLAAELGFPNCDVTKLLSRQEVLASSRRIGIENLETSSEWAGVLVATRPGDQLRLVNCLNSRKVRGARGGYSTYGLYRSHKMVLEFG